MTSHASHQNSAPREVLEFYIFSPGNSFKSKFKELMKERHRLLSIKDMGFPPDWEHLPVWEN